MNEINWLIGCLIVASLLPYLAKVPLALAMYKEGDGPVRGYDNRQPRIQQQKLTGFGARCLAAHENSFEALILFATAILLTLATDNADRHSAFLASVFIISRIAYLFCYWLNWDKLRSTVWAIGIISSVSIMFASLK